MKRKSRDQENQEIRRSQEEGSEDREVKASDEE
jgi:hypothetical protein